VEEQLKELDRILNPEHLDTEKAKEEMVARQAAFVDGVDTDPTHSNIVRKDIFAVLREPGNAGDTPLLTEFKKNKEFNFAWNNIDIPNLSNHMVPLRLFSLVRILRDLVRTKRAAFRSSTT